MPICHQCNKSSIFDNTTVYSVQEDISKPTFRGPAHRICGECFINYENNNKCILTIKKIYWSRRK